MTFPWQEMSVEEFAGFDRLLGERIIQMEGMHWSRVRPLFYRPVLPFHEFSPGSVKFPSLALLGGFQHAVPAGQRTNSCLNLLMFQDAQAYSLEALDYNRKRQVKQAAKCFEIRSIADVQEFKQEGYPVYLDFYERTSYQYGSERRNPAFFAQWAEALFQLPKAVVLGGYRNGALEGVSVSLLVKDTLCYAMFFCNTQSLRLGLSDLMLHYVREVAAKEQCAKQVFAGTYKGGKGLDDFYLLRGCKLVRKPALLYLSPLARFVLEHFLPGEYARLKGYIANVTGDRHKPEAGSRAQSGRMQPPERRDKMGFSKSENKGREVRNGQIGHNGSNGQQHPAGWAFRPQPSQPLESRD